MSRSELGALVSRALAVWCVGYAAHRFFEAAATLANPVVVQRRAMSDPNFASSAVWLILGLLLWFKAGTFGTWSVPEPATDPQEPRVDKASVATGLLQAAALYWVVYAVVHICAPLTNPMMYQLSSTAARDETYANMFGLGILALLALILLVSARELSRKLCKA